MKHGITSFIRLRMLQPFYFNLQLHCSLRLKVDFEVKHVWRGLWKTIKQRRINYIVLDLRLTTKLNKDYMIVWRGLWETMKN